MLVTLVPSDKVAGLDAAYEGTLAGVPDGPDLGEVSVVNDERVDDPGAVQGALRLASMTAGGEVSACVMPPMARSAALSRPTSWPWARL